MVRPAVHSRCFSRNVRGLEKRKFFFFMVCWLEGVSELHVALWKGELCFDCCHLLSSPLSSPTLSTLNVLRVTGDESRRRVVKAAVEGVWFRKTCGSRCPLPPLRNSSWHSNFIFFLRRVTKWPQIVEFNSYTRRYCLDAPLYIALVSVYFSEHPRYHINPTAAQDGETSPPPTE